MAEGRTKTMMEIWPIERHLNVLKEKYTSDSECIFVAPSIYPDSRRQIDWIAADTNGEDRIRPYKIDEFIDFLETSEHLYAL